MKLLTEFAIQLYTLRDEIGEIGFEETFRRLSAMGYTGVEFAGYGDVPAGEMKRLMDENGLSAVGSHVQLEALETDLDGQLAYAKTIGLQNIIVPYATMETEDEARAVAARLKALAPKITAAGFTFGYHNHAHEFAAPNGRSLLDILLSEVPAGDMMLELDLYWAAFAGQDAETVLKQYAGRIKLLHIKQIADFETKACVDLNEGVLDFAHLIALAKENGVQHFVLEQEEFKNSPWESAEVGVKYILNLEE